MSYEAQSLLTLLALILGAVVVFMLVMLWWIDRYVDRIFNSDRQHIHD